VGIVHMDSENFFKIIFSCRLKLMRREDRAAIMSELGVERSLIRLLALYAARNNFRQVVHTIILPSSSSSMLHNLVPV